MIDDWLSSAESGELPPAERLVVIAPHPDDETLGAGGAIAARAGGARPTVVVAVTDGEACFGSPDPAVARIRRGELDAALLALDPGATCIRLGLRDGSVTAVSWSLTEALTSIIEPEDLVLAPWRRDWHPDHEAVGAATRRACQDTGARLWSMLFWGLHHRSPADLGAHEHLVAVSLDTDHERRRARAWAAHASQQDPVHPVVTADETAHLASPAELYIATRPTAGTRP